TAELALALPAVVLVLAVVLVTASAGAARLRCEDAARAAARVASTGVSDDAVHGAALEVMGRPVEVTVRRDPPWVVVDVVTVMPGGWFTGGALGLSATATALLEPSVGGHHHGWSP
ncbi:TadE family protein, partial [Cellulomonas bogoriensis 69B4 = DSM 16987]